LISGVLTYALSSGIIVIVPPDGALAGTIEVKAQYYDGAAWLTIVGPSVTCDSVQKEVPATFSGLAVGDHTVNVVTMSVTVNAAVYPFSQWEDGSTASARTVSISSGETKTLTVSYKKTQDLQGRGVFTFLNQVTAEKAQWAKSLGFTDIGVFQVYDVPGSGQTAESACNYITAAGMTYWRCLSYFPAGEPREPYNLGTMTSTTVEDFAVKLRGLISTSPNHHVIIDDTHYIVISYGVGAMNNLFEAIRQVQTQDLSCSIDTFGFMDEVVISSSSWYARSWNPPAIDMHDVTIDIYHTPTYSYNTIKPYLDLMRPSTIGVFLWAYPDYRGAVSFTTMTTATIDKIYGEAKSLGAKRMLVWSGWGAFDFRSETDPTVVASSLHSRPDLWDYIRAANLDFVNSS
jgi:hypothetical protein